MAVYFVASVARTDRPFNFGLVMVFAAAGPILAILIADTLFGFLPEDACAGDETCFPDAYDAAGRAVLQLLVAKTATFYGEVELIWTPLTLLLNGIGLAGVIAIIDKVGGWAVAIQNSGDLEGSNANILQEQAARAAQSQQRDYMLTQVRSSQQSQDPIAQQRRLIPQFTLKLPLEPLSKDDVDDEILEPPAHC